MAIAVNVYAQEVNTHAYYYILSHPDENQQMVVDEQGETQFDVYIGTDSIVLSVIPKQVYMIEEVLSSTPYQDGTLVTFKTYDQDQVGCKVSLLVLPDYKEIHFTYVNANHCFLLRDE